MSNNSKTVYDFIIVGSGFGGSVSAMRLSQKGYKVLVLEKGSRFQDSDFPKTNWNIFKFLWAPVLRCFGIQQITPLKDIFVLHGAGVGGGSLVYANTLMMPQVEVFDKPEWPQKINWKDELQSCFEVAKKMLGVSVNSIMAESDFALQELAEKLGFGNTFHPTHVGVFLGAAGKKVRDPYFQGDGPDRVGCTACGGCMIGCRVGAKNTLEKNYLYFAEKWGTQIFSRCKVRKIIPHYLNSSPLVSYYEVSTQKGYFKGKNVILSSGVLGTIELLFKNKEKYKTLPNISEKLGESVRTNGESLLGVTSFDKHRDLSRGLAIGSAFHMDIKTKIESVRYPSGSSVMKFLAVPLTPNGSLLTRPLKMFLEIFKKIPRMVKLLFVRDWAKQSVILLVMQSVESKMKIKMGKWFLKGDSSTEKIPSYIPFAQNAALKMGEIINGEAQNCISEVLVGSPATAHILGGCCMGDSISNGVINSRHEVFGYNNLFVCDGSVIPVNLGVNPSLTITALAERFAHQFPLNEGVSTSEYMSRQIHFNSN